MDKECRFETQVKILNEEWNQDEERIYRLIIAICFKLWKISKSLIYDRVHVFR